MYDIFYFYFDLLLTKPLNSLCSPIYTPLRIGLDLVVVCTFRLTQELTLFLSFMGPTQSSNTSTIISIIPLYPSDGYNVQKPVASSIADTRTNVLRGSGGYGGIMCNIFRSSTPVIDGTLEKPLI